MNLLDRLGKKLGIQGREWVVFILSLLLAFVIWLIDNLSDSYVKTVSVPVTAACSMDGYAARSASPAVVMARCRTSGYDFVRMGRRRDPVVVTFQAADMHHKEEDIFFMTASEINRYSQAIFGDDALVDAVLTDTLYFRFHPENCKKVPVQPVCTIGFRPQYMSEKGIVLIPDSVLVYGEPFHLEGIDRVFTRHIALPELSAPDHGTVALETSKEVRLSQEEVEYHIDVERFVEVSETVHLRARGVPTGRSLTIYPSSAKVTYRLAFPVLGDPEGNVQFYIDYRDFAGSLSGKCLPRHDGLPRGVLSYSIDPPVFECVESLR